MSRLLRGTSPLRLPINLFGSCFRKSREIDTWQGSDIDDQTSEPLFNTGVMSGKKLESRIHVKLI